MIAVATWGLTLSGVRFAAETGVRSRSLVAAGAVAIGTGVFLVGRAGATLRTYRRLRDLEPAPIAAATEGLVAVSGEATAVDGTVETPFSGTEALVHESTVFEPADDLGRMEPERPSAVDDWNATRLFDDAVPFAVDDGTGRLRVEPDGANFELRPLPAVEVGADEEPPARIAALFLSTQRLNDTTRHRRYEETALTPGDRVTVVGSLDDGVLSAAPDASGRFAAPPPFVVATGSTHDLVEAYRYRIATGVAGAVGVCWGVLSLLYGAGAA